MHAPAAPERRRGRINVDGVLLSLVGSGASSVMASVTATGAVRLPGGVANRVTVIENVVDPLEDENVKVGQKLTLIRHEGEPKEDDPSVFHLVITEPPSTPLMAPSLS